MKLAVNAYSAEELVHRPFYCAIVDEADSILIDEARIYLVVESFMIIRILIY
ncbi:hypothetical protein [Clostridium sp.]|uniref:hypothetical protein n=1 Tax=Clostridium sp. TaxID=1506 RepID=UPI00260C4BC9|nr:hypothetical protein [Clostridium sp.]